ncbi:MAG TPA: non-heme iron oxygenase ferredoxin subunit [Aquihabitans sp.]|jgi:3-phenylpropionate/trans-cinnamate dioxygenase ferredoxin subunit|nr:non-heme iron oxygenase ferredoxin subunit [Aquihabitans sp.]
MTEVPVADLHDLPDGGATRVDVDGHRLAVVRIGDDVYVIGDRCSHADFSLSEGEVDPDTCHIECWKHGSSFSLRTGEPDVLPATRPVPVYDVRVVDGKVLVALPEATEGGSHV